MTHPLDITENAYLKYIVFASLYFSEGIMIAFSTVVLPVYLVEKNVSLSLMGLVIGITMIPWIAKFVFGGIVDKFRNFGRRPFILLGGVMASIFMIITSFIDPSIALVPFVIFMFLTRCGVVFLDVSSDGMAVEVAKPRERGKVNGFMFGGQFLGMAFGSFIIPQIAAVFGYQWAFISTAFAVISVIILPLLIREQINREKSIITKTLIMEFKRKVILVLLFFLPLTTVSIGLLETIMPPHMKLSLGIGIASIGVIALSYSLSMAAGSIVGGFLSDKYNRKNILFTFIFLAAITSFMLILTRDFMSMILIWSFVGFTHGGTSTIISAISMGYVNPKVGATQFSIMMGFVNLGMTFGALISGLLVTSFGFRYIFIFSALIYIPAIIYLNFIKLKRTEKTDIPIVKPMQK